MAKTGNKGSKESRKTKSATAPSKKKEGPAYLRKNDVLGSTPMSVKPPRRK